MHMKYFHQGIQQCWGSWDTAFLVQATKAARVRGRPFEGSQRKAHMLEQGVLGGMAEVQKFKNFLISLSDKQ